MLNSIPNTELDYLINFDSAEDAINQDGSFLAQKDGLWGLFDDYEPENPVVPYQFSTKEELIRWYFDDMGWNDLHLHHS